jgi:hypothetical protein
MEEITQLGLAARLQRLEDREELRDLAARYCTTVDDRDLDQLVLLFASESVFGGARTVYARGRYEIKEFLSERLAAYGPTFHYPHTQVVEFMSDDEARGLVTAHAEHGLDGQLAIAGLRYHDVYAREDGAWRFRERMLHFQYFMDMASLQDQYSAPLRRLRPEPVAADYPETLATWQAFQAEVVARETSK